MKTDSIPLGNATVEFRRGAHMSRLTARAASISVVPGRRPVRLCLEGPNGSVIIELSRVVFWQLTNEFHERSIAADGVRPKQHKARP